MRDEKWEVAKHTARRSLHWGLAIATHRLPKYTHDYAISSDRWEFAGGILGILEVRTSRLNRRVYMLQTKIYVGLENKHWWHGWIHMLSCGDSWPYKNLWTFVFFLTFHTFARLFSFPFFCFSTSLEPEFQYCVCT